MEIRQSYSLFCDLLKLQKMQKVRISGLQRHLQVKRYVCKPLVRAAGSQPSQQIIVFSRWEPAEPANHCFQPLGASEVSKSLFSAAGSQRSQQTIVLTINHNHFKNQ